MTEQEEFELLSLERERSMTQAPQQQSTFQKFKTQISDPRNISAMARPVLQGGGAILGGMAGAPAAIPSGGLSVAAGGAAGFATGNLAANLLDRKLGLMKPIQNIPEAISETGNSLKEGATAEAIGGAMAPALRLGGKILKPFSSTLTGIPKEEYAVLAKNPSAILPGKLKAASRNLDVAKEAGGIKPDPVADINRALRDDKPFVKQLRDKMAGGEVLTPREAFEGNQAINNLIKKETDADAKRGLLMLKKSFQENLDSLPGGVLKALKQYSTAKGASKFWNILPQTQSMKGAVLRTMGVMGGLSASAMSGNPIPGLVALGHIPALAGAGTIAGSAATNALSNPAVRHGVVSPFIAALLASRRKEPQ